MDWGQKICDDNTTLKLKSKGKRGLKYGCDVINGRQ